MYLPTGKVYKFCCTLLNNNKKCLDIFVSQIYFEILNIPRHVLLNKQVLVLFIWHMLSYVSHKYIHAIELYIHADSVKNPGLYSMWPWCGLKMWTEVDQPSLFLWKIIVYVQSILVLTCLKRAMVRKQCWSHMLYLQAACPGWCCIFVLM